MEEQFVQGVAKAILEKYADPLMTSIPKRLRKEWEKFKIDFDFVFIKYLKNAYAKYSKIKTILYKTEPQFIYDFFEIPNVKRGEEVIKAENVDSILDISQFIIIQGSGGIGKSTLMKHLFINEINNKDLIPIYVELKDLNDIDGPYDIAEILVKKLNNLGSTLKEEFFDYALKSGCFLFLLDGYDEILTEKRNAFFRLLDEFCDRYSNNYFVISSRPFSEFIEMQRFTVLETCPFSKEQALSLINRISYDEGIKRRFISALDQELYEKHQSFASNPLLLSIMLLTFENYANIPSKLHLFYANAFETLFEKHDATKAGFRREMKCGLPFDSFRKVFSCFCFRTYAQGKIEFSKDELIDHFKKLPNIGVVYNIDDYIFDLVNSLCVLYKDGLNYKFTHRSFQEYFTAFFLKELPDENMSSLSINMIHKDVYRSAHDNVFPMLNDMNEERFEINIILPILNEFEQDMSGERYDYYFEEFVFRVEFENIDKKRRFVVGIGSNNKKIGAFISSYALFRASRDEAEKIAHHQAEAELYEYLVNYYAEVDRNQERISLDSKSILQNPTLNDLVKKTWIGTEIIYMSQLKETIEKKKKNMTIDLNNLLLV